MNHELSLIINGLRVQRDRRLEARAQEIKQRFQSSTKDIFSTFFEVIKNYIQKGILNEIYEIRELIHIS